MDPVSVAIGILVAALAAEKIYRRDLTWSHWPEIRDDLPEDAIVAADVLLEHQAPFPAPRMRAELLEPDAEEPNLVNARLYIGESELCDITLEITRDASRAYQPIGDISTWCSDPSIIPDDPYEIDQFIWNAVEAVNQALRDTQYRRHPPHHPRWASVYSEDDELYAEGLQPSDVSGEAARTAARIANDLDEYVYLHDYNGIYRVSPTGEITFWSEYDEGIQD